LDPFSWNRILSTEQNQIHPNKKPSPKKIFSPWQFLKKNEKKTLDVHKVSIAIEYPVFLEAPGDSLSTRK